MKRLLGIITIVFLVIIVLVAARLCVEKVEIDKVGVRSNLMTQSVEKDDLKPGFHWAIPTMHRIDVLDPTWQFLTLDNQKALRLRGADQYLTEIDISIIYRIKPGQAHRVITLIGMGETFKTRIEDVAKKLAWDVLAELNTEDFYNAHRRARQADKVRDEMNTALAQREWPMEVKSVLIRDVRFDQAFEDRLLEKQLLDQKKLLNVSLKTEQQELMKTQLIEKETEAMVIAIEQEREREIVNVRAETNAQIAEIHATSRLEAESMIAEAERYMREKTAEGELLKTQAQAEGDKAINEAYQGFGGQTYLVRKMLENIEFGEIEINTNKTNPFDVEQLLDMLGVGYQPEE